MLAVANQRPGVLERYALSREEVERSAWAIDREGRRLEGAAAISRGMTALGGYPSWFAAAYRVRPIGAVEDALYGWFAPRRSRFERLGIRPECDEPDSGCEER